MATIRHYYSVATCFARLAIQRQLEYPLFLFSWLLMIPIQYFSGIWMLKIIVDRFQPLGGWDFPELAFIYGLGLLSHGIMVVLFINTWHIDGMVIDGAFDRLLLRPMNVFFQLIASYFNFIGLIDLIPGMVIFIYGCHLVGFDWTMMNIIKIILVIIGGVLIRASLFITLGTIAFWTKRNASMVGFALSMLERGTMYPLSIFPYMIQLLFTFLVPIGFITFYPSIEFLGKSGEFGMPTSIALWTPIIGILCFWLSQRIFKFGLRNYESAGS
ncbi:ABC-2 type transport system permease protein [Paenibacillus taihuensis]|uniref:ABC-2 type transport system permease protein n=1 Tax=Paenibacillus taihuensis TaxID=1156355 RepID=A0A3D9SDE6_9BACL|nr:ABC-2 family transporter protein [Paenibacillus taihuensis]REE89041.1 ABC-2 type transport system permease protein [Paenibacillus taihuensis]